MTASSIPAVNKLIYAFAAITAVAIGSGIYVSQQRASQPPADVPGAAQSFQPGTLAVLRTHVDLGTISMRAGKVTYQYLIKNTTATPLTVSRISTSCMCTEATLVTAKGRTGPFGMPGHGGSTSLRAVLAPGELANLDVVFDPAAHGPSGLGYIERFVTVESAEARPLELRMAVLVKP